MIELQTETLSPNELSENEQPEKNRVLGGTLYLVGTPIGNLADLSQRAVKVLSQVDFIAAEDTRNSLRLLTYLGIQKPLVSYFEHNKQERGPQIAERLLAGESCALVTDAGMPAISDPGEDLVALCAVRGIPVTTVPGPCAAITALTLSGLPTARFAFEGFLSAQKNDRRQRLKELENETRTLLFHEAPHKLRATLSDMAEAFGGDRRIALCRELTKRNEEIQRMTVAEAVAYYEANDPRGEYVLVLEGNSAPDKADEAFWTGLDVPAHVRYYMDTEGLSQKDAIKAAAKDRGVPKNEVYMQIVAAEKN